MRVVLAGTGTGVGKTFVASALLTAAHAAGLRVTAWKPIETGGDDDALALAATGQPLWPTTYRFAPPISPHLAARRAGVAIDLGRLAMDAPADPLLVECAGGLFTPVAEGSTNHDLAKLLAADALWLVVRERLGALHDAIATTRAAIAGGRPVDALVVNTFGPTDESTGTNVAELRAILGIPTWNLTEAIAAFNQRLRSVGPG